MEHLLLRETERQWNALLKLKQFSVKKRESQLYEAECDPFSCASRTPSTTREFVEEILDDHVQQWKELDQRRVVDDDSNSVEHGGESIDGNGQIADDKLQSENDADETNNGTQINVGVNRRKRKLKGGWLSSDRRIKLPEHFDFATRRTAPPDDDGGGDRVISLVDPSIHLSYHQELWKLFAAVPTVDTIQKHAKSGINVPHASNIHREVNEGIQLYARLDAHALSRMRMSDRHGLPSVVARGDLEATKQAEEINLSRYSTIRLECWKRQPNRGTAPDPNRAQLEFLGSQTLLDVHRCLAQLAEDDLWAVTYNGNKTNKRSNNAATEPAGYFFIEDQFYTTGDVDYVSPIQRWLDDPDKPSGIRHKYLGISTSNRPLPVKPMGGTRLDQIPFRLATRYHHVCNGDIECAIFVVDMRLAPKPNVSYPILHDIWCPSYPLPQCEACRQYPVIFATSSTCKLTDGGPRTLCEACCVELELFEKEGDSIRLYSEWRNQPDLSSGSSRDQGF